MYVQFAKANFMKNTLFANNKTWNIYCLRLLSLNLGWINHQGNDVFSQLMLLFVCTASRWQVCLKCFSFTAFHMSVRGSSSVSQLKTSLWPQRIVYTPSVNVSEPALSCHAALRLTLLQLLYLTYYKTGFRNLCFHNIKPGNRCFN